MTSSQSGDAPINIPTVGASAHAAPGLTEYMEDLESWSSDWTSRLCPKEGVELLIWGRLNLVSSTRPRLPYRVEILGSHSNSFPLLVPEQTYVCKLPEQTTSFGRPVSHCSSSITENDPHTRVCFHDFQEAFRWALGLTRWHIFFK